MFWIPLVIVPPILRMILDQIRFGFRFCFPHILPLLH